MTNKQWDLIKDIIPGKVGDLAEKEKTIGFLLMLYCT